MKKVIYLLPMGLLFLCTTARAQRANIDSLELVAQISQDQLKLGKLQNMVDERTSNKKAAAVDAQKSASDNVTAAERLNADPNNKKLASDASSKAGDAKSDAGKSRKESRRLDDLNKDIADLKGKIAIAQAKLTVYTPTQPLLPIPLPMPQVDTTKHQ
jgi:hypothetical protein